MIERYDFEDKIVNILQDKEISDKKAELILELVLFGFDEGYKAKEKSKQIRDEICLEFIPKKRTQIK